MTQSQHNVPDLDSIRMETPDDQTTEEAVNQYQSVIEDNLKIEVSEGTIFGSGAGPNYELDEEGLRDDYDQVMQEVAEIAREADVSVTDEVSNLDFTLGIAAGRYVLEETQGMEIDAENPIGTDDYGPNFGASAIYSIKNALEDGDAEVEYTTTAFGDEESETHTQDFSPNSFGTGVKEVENTFVDENDFEDPQRTDNEWY